MVKKSDPYKLGWESANLLYPDDAPNWFDEQDKLEFARGFRDCQLFNTLAGLGLALLLLMFFVLLAVFVVK
jgi:hypothetical protein